VSENLVRDIHDAVAESENLVEASVRPLGTTQREMRAMRRDVLRKLRLAPGMSVAEIGCGVGVLGVPIARAAARYVGLDFAPQAVRVANERLRAAGLGDRAHALLLDVMGATEEDLRGLGRFDRVLLYAVLNTARGEQEATRFLQRTVDLLAPGGRALVGNVPLRDLEVDWAPSEHPPRGLLARLVAAGRWIAIPGAAPVPLTPSWKARRTVEMMIKVRSRRPVDAFAPVWLPTGYTLALTTAAVERWLATLDAELTHHWELPAPGVPLACARADLIILRR
jgi:predicted O-methyltransferase YrrM